ncbi:MAG: ABC transporter [Anaerolineae bacterium SM23_ 63]|nr:MAG: ABC transporter [Anaerolineae bacterium SM23_ 63]HEY48089.1 ABC transporter ATP-binding protein [Anaerolineae bacterium]
MSEIPAIQVEALTRVYKIRGGKKSDPKELVALKDVNIQVSRSELFGLLGPNGAGKTTLIKVLTTLLAPTSGRACVAGFDVTKEPHEIRARINMVSGGESSGYGLLTVRENLWMFSQFYGIPSKEANRRIKELLEVVGLGDRLNTKSSDLSSGLRQKMNIVRGFMTDPEVLFLDEPTLGLDVGAARDVRSFIREWMDEKQDRTILLTTHYMVEAEQLCDRVAIINEGRVLACDTPAALKHQLQEAAIFQLQVSPLDGTPPETFERIRGVRHFTYCPEDGFATLEFVLEEEDVLAAVVNQLTAHDIHLQNLEKREPSLEDVFVHLVGMSMEEVERGESN